MGRTALVHQMRSQQMTQQLEDLQAKLEQMRQVYEEEKTKRLRIEKKFKTLEKKYRQLERSIRPNVLSPERRLRRLNPLLTAELPNSMDISPSLAPVSSSARPPPHEQQGVPTMGVIDLTSPTSATALLSVNTSTVSDQIVERARMNRDRNQEERRQRIENLVERISSYTPEQEENEQHYRLRSSVSHRTRSAPGASLTRHDDLVERILSRSSSRIRPSPRTLSASTDTMMDTSSSGGEASQSLPPPSSGNHAETDAAFARRLQLEYLQAYQEEEHQRQRARQQALERRQFDHTTTTSSINPDEMSYDELLRLGEQMGDVKKEKWRQIAVQVLSSLPTHRWKKTHHSNTIEDKELDHTCVICQYNFIPNDQIITLPCAHIFHELCVEGWIRENNSCPLCKNEIMAVY